MTLKAKFQQIFSNRAETSENHVDSTLKTHYFKATQQKAFQACLDLINKKDGYHAIAIDEERGEITVEVVKPKKALMVITIVTVQPFRTAIDFSVSTETKLPTDFQYSSKLIVSTYDSLKKTLTFIGQGRID